MTAAFFRQLVKIPRLPAGLVAAGLLWLCGTNVAAEIAPPEGGSLDFAIVRKGEVIGGYKADFNRLADGRLEVTLLVKADVGLGPISLYHFHQVTREVWRGEQLVAMRTVATATSRVFRTGFFTAAICVRRTRIAVHTAKCKTPWKPGQ